MNKRVIFSFSFCVFAICFSLMHSFSLASSVEEVYGVVLGQMTVLTDEQAVEVGCVARIIDKDQKHFCVESNAMLVEMKALLKSDVYQVSVLGKIKKDGEKLSVEIEV